MLRNFSNLSLKRGKISIFGDGWEENQVSTTKTNLKEFKAVFEDRDPDKDTHTQALYTILRKKNLHPAV